MEYAMKINFKKLFDNNKFIVILSVLIAVVAFFVVKITMVPVDSRTLSDVPVTIDLAGTAAEKADLSVIGDTDFKVDVTVTGTRSIVGGLKAADIQIEANTAVVTKAGTYQLELEVVNGAADLTYEISPRALTVNFDTIISKEIEVTAETGNLTVPEGFILEIPFAQPETVTVQGPKTDVEKIVKCVARADVSGTLQETTVSRGEVSFYDANNNKLEFDQYLTYTPQTINVTVPVYKQKTVPLTFAFTNVPDGFPIDQLKYEMSHSEITIATPNNAVDSISELSVGNIDFRKVDVGSVITLDVNLPSSYRNVDNITQVTVTFPSEGMGSKLLTISNLNIVNTPAEYNIQLVTNRLSNVKIVGDADVVKGITAADVVASIDLMDTTVTTGQFSVPVKISVPNKGLVWAAGEYTVVIRASEK